MKKLFLVGVLAIGSLSVAAHVPQSPKDEMVNIMVQSSEFTEIAISELPTAITAAVAETYPTATIGKAYVNEEKQYKLEVSLKDGTTGTLYADENGNWLNL